MLIPIPHTDYIRDASNHARAPMHTVQINDRIERATVKPYLKGDFGQPMLWVKVHATNGRVLSRYIVPATLIAGKPVHFNKTTFTYLG